MTPFAPVRLSTTMFCPSWLSTWPASVLASASGVPPAGNGMSRRMGRLGYACAQALGPQAPLVATAIASATDADAVDILFILSVVLPRAAARLPATASHAQ